MKKIIISIFLFFVLFNGGDVLGSPADKNKNLIRTFYMGFTPWAYDPKSRDKFLDMYRKINFYGDIVAHQFMTGIPWYEAYQKTPYHRNVEGDINDRLLYTNEGKEVYLAIDSLNGTRDGIVPHWGKEFNERLSFQWRKYDFDSPEIIQAYTNFAIDMIERFNPKYFNYATEISELILKEPKKFEQFKVFAQGVYSNVKLKYPTLPLLVSVAFKNPNSKEALIIKERMSEISNYYDILGISTYGYIFFDLYQGGGAPSNLPLNWLSQAKQIAGDKPIAITETGWIAEDYPLGKPFDFTVKGTSEFQAAYLRKLFLEANDLDVQFIIWFSVVDYDAWQSVYGNVATRIWQDIGLFDEKLKARPALSVWNNWFLRKKHSSSALR